MAIISPIGRRSLKVRALIWTIYLLLIAGAVTMVYPFLLMLSGSTKTAVDTPDADIIPPFLANDGALYSKYVEGLFNESLNAMQIAYDSDASSFQTVTVPDHPNARLVATWREFLNQSPPRFYDYTLGYLFTPLSRSALPHELRAFKGRLIDEYGGDINRMNRALGTEFVNWNAFYVLPEDYLLRRNNPGNSPMDLAFRAFKEKQPEEARCYFSPDGFYKTSYLKTQYSKDIAQYNATHGTKYASWDQVHLDRRLPAGPDRTDKERADWESFVRTILNLRWIRADAEAAPFYQQFLQAKYRDIETLNRIYGTGYKSFEEVKLFAEPPEEGLVLSDWDAFLQGWNDPDTGKVHMLPADKIYVQSIDFRFRDFLKAKFDTVENMNRTLGTTCASWLDVIPPQRDLQYMAFQEQKSWWRREFVKRNYISVVDYVVLHGRGIVNTVIYCGLAIFAALIVNPIAAYALSRYKPPSAYKVLLVLMLTMAFPPMVTQIPVFLMLREFNLLNTFWALILPGIANGYAIFLLKGFFDSLPQELYESAEMDGAGEFRIFWQITMSLSTPILAVIALNAFTLAYSNFMMAMLICQDEKMWTLMPWLYQLQQRSGQGVIYASLIVASIPTFLIFAFCQKIIMRGIVVPVEK